MEEESYEYRVENYYERGGEKPKSFNDTDERNQCIDYLTKVFTKIYKRRNNNKQQQGKETYRMNYKPPVPLSKSEKREAMLLGVIVALSYLFALGYYLL